MKDPRQLDLFLPDNPPLLTYKTETSKNDVMIGDSGEDLALFKLKKWGFSASKAPQGTHYDLEAEMSNSKLIPIQTKTSSVVKNSMSYNFKRGFHGSKKGVFDYKENDFDIACCVNLVDEKVLFSKGVCKRINWKRSQFLQEDAEQVSWINSVQGLI